MPLRTTPLRILAALTVAALTLTACSSDPEKKAVPVPDPKNGTSAKLVEISPLTGKALPNGRPDNPVFVVKVENTANGSPQYGLDKADLVVEELVEGGLTRLAAFYYSTLPSKVGHVRSMRATDIGIAAPVGGQIVASGGAGGTYKRVKNAGITVFSEDFGAPGFSSDPAKSRPYNRLTNLKRVAKKAKDSRIFGPYLTWTPKASKRATPPPTSDPTASATATPVAPKPKRANAATVGFSNFTRTEWALKGKTWRRTNGFAASGQEFAADTLIVMFCKVGDAGYRDPAGNPVPETELEGTGRAMLFNGKNVTEAAWTKDSVRSTISFAAKGGSPVTVDPGNVFVELIPKDGGSVKLR